jgi:hypothetical protein
LNKIKFIDMKIMHRIVMLSGCMLISLGLLAQNDKKVEKDVMRISLNDSTEIEVRVKGMTPEQQDELKGLIRGMAGMVQGMNSSKMNMWVQDEDNGFEFSFNMNPDSLEKGIEEWAKEVENLAKEMEAIEGEVVDQRKVDSLSQEGHHVLTFGTNGFKITEVDGNGADIKEDKEPTAFETQGMFQLGLGFANHLNANKELLSKTNDPYTLKTWGSSVVDLIWSFKTRVGKQGPLYLKYGLGASFYKYSIDNDRYIEEVGNGVSFVKDPDIEIRKASFSNTQLILPFMVMLDFDENGEESKFNLGAGGFVGYRIGASAKRKYENAEGNKQKDHERGSFYMNDFQYGLQAQVGVGGVKLFARYHMNSLFEANAGPEMYPISFGVVF